MHLFWREICVPDVTTCDMYLTQDCYTHVFVKIVKLTRDSRALRDVFTICIDKALVYAVSGRGQTHCLQDSSTVCGSTTQKACSLRSHQISLQTSALIWGCMLDKVSLTYNMRILWSLHYRSRLCSCMADWLENAMFQPTATIRSWSDDRRPAMDESKTETVLASVQAAKRFQTDPVHFTDRSTGTEYRNTSYFSLVALLALNSRLFPGTDIILTACTRFSSLRSAHI